MSARKEAENQGGKEEGRRIWRGKRDGRTTKKQLCGVDKQRRTRQTQGPGPPHGHAALWARTQRGVTGTGYLQVPPLPVSAKSKLLPLTPANQYVPFSLL